MCLKLQFLSTEMRRKPQEHWESCIIWWMIYRFKFIWGAWRIYYMCWLPAIPLQIVIIYQEHNSIKQSRLLLRLALYLCMYLSCFIPNLIQTYYDLHSARLSFVAGWLPPQTKERGYTVVESQGFGGAYNFLVQISLGDDFNEEQKPMWLLPTFQVCGGWRNII